MSKPSDNVPAGDHSPAATPSTQAEATLSLGPKTLIDSAMPDFALHASMGGYRILELLGEGAMGKVYLAQHEILGRPAAIKVLHAERADQQAVERFFQEARAASAINHPGIVNVYDVGQGEAGSYLVMELLDGETLEQRLAREDRLDIRHAVRFAVQIASALDVAHQNGIVHRDLKPGNIFISPDPAVSGGERIKILDFGIAKMVSTDAADPNVSQTRSDMLLGSPVYMSPEQCRGAQSVDGRADLYSLGCILYEMLCGRPPFDQQVVAAVIAAHLRETPPPPTSFRPEISLELEKIILHLLAKDADQRFQSAAAFVDAVIQQGGDSLVAKTGMGRTLFGASRFFTTMVTERKRRPLGVLVLLALAAAVVLLVMVLRGKDAPETPGAPEPVAAAVIDPAPEPDELPTPPRPEMTVRMLDPEQEQAVKSRKWDKPPTEEVMLELLNPAADMDISMAVASIPLLSIGPDNKIMAPWFIVTEPPGATVTYADGTVFGTTPIFSEIAIVQHEETLTVALEGYEPEEIPAKFYMPMQRQLALVPMPEVTVATDPPGAAVYENDAPIATTPWTTPLSRKARRTLSLRLDGYEDHDLELAGGMTFDQPLVLQPLAKVELDTRPRRVEVLEDGQAIATTPYTTTFSVKKGTPRTLVLSAGEAYEDQTVVLGPGQELPAEVIELVPKVKLEVRTRKPERAAILDDAGNLIQETPWTVYVARSEPPRTVTLKHPDYEDYTLEIGPDATLPRKIDMVAIPAWTVDSKPPGAEILAADGQKLGVTPMRFQVPAAQGPIQLTLRSPGFDDLAVTLTHDKKPPRRFELARRVTITLESTPPGARVTDASGRDLGTTPLTLETASGREKLAYKLELAGYQPRTVEVEPSRDRKEKFDLAAEARDVTLEIISEPEGADVYIGRKKVGQTPYQATYPSSAGTTKYSLRLEGHETEDIRVANDQDKKVEVELTPCKRVVGITDPYSKCN